jgi:hypothetical protein
MPDDGVGSGDVVACQKVRFSSDETIEQKGKKAISEDIAFLTIL